MCVSVKVEENLFLAVHQMENFYLSCCHTKKTIEYENIDLTLHQKPGRIQAVNL